MNFTMPNLSNRAAILTLGCKVNFYESALMTQRLQADNWQIVSPKEHADLYVIHSCTVTAEAGRQTRQEIRRASRRNPEAFLVVTGCYAEMEAEACKKMPEVSMVLPNKDKLLIAERVQHFCNNPTEQTNLGQRRQVNAPVVPDAISGYTDRTRAFVQVQQGCDQGCTFCIIHTARGASKSHSQEQVVVQIQALLRNGYREIVICGIDLGSWGADLVDDGSGKDITLACLLKEVLSLSGEYRIRLSSIDPVHLDNTLLDLIAADSRLCPHLHLSLQSANGLILKRMKRRYDPEFLYDRVHSAQARIPNLLVSADVLVGFPTETAAQFEDTLKAIYDLKIAYPHVFPYSKRMGTPAARIPSQTTKQDRKDRALLIREAGDHVRRAIFLERIGVIERVLVERSSGGATNQYHGRADNYLPVYLQDNPVAVGQFAQARISNISDNALIAQIQESE